MMQREFMPDRGHSRQSPPIQSHGVYIYPAFVYGYLNGLPSKYRMVQ